MLPFTNRNRVTSPFGPRSLNGQISHHSGMDIVGVDSADVRAVRAGKVLQSNMVTDRSNRTWEWGNYVCVQGADGMLYYYCHMESRAVSAGEAVEEGAKLGVMGNTGYSFGAHLHFELRTADRKSVNPCTVLGIPNEAGTYTDSGTAPSPRAATPAASVPQSGQAAKQRTLRVFGGAKGLHVEGFTGKDVALVAKDAANADVHVSDGCYPVLSLEGHAGAYDWCKIDYKGRALYMPYGGVLNDRCALELP